jgi:hypothetical protein
MEDTMTYLRDGQKNTLTVLKQVLARLDQLYTMETQITIPPIGTTVVAREDNNAHPTFHEQAGCTAASSTGGGGTTSPNLTIDSLGTHILAPSTIDTPSTWCPPSNAN